MHLTVLLEPRQHPLTLARQEPTSAERPRSAPGRSGVKTAGYKITGCVAMETPPSDAVKSLLLVLTDACIADCRYAVWT